MVKKTLDEIVQERVAKEVAALKDDLSSELQQVISAGFSAALGGAGGLAGTALDGILSGKKVDLRELFNNSSSQIGEQLAGFITSAQRNF